MVATAMKHMASNFANLDKFKEADFRRWQKKIRFLLSNMSVVYVLTTLITEDGKNATVDQIKRRNKFDNDEYVCGGLILIVLEQYNELLGILRRFTQHKMNMDEAIQISYVINRLLFSWKYFKHTLKHNMKELTLVELGSHLRIEESLRAHHSDKPKGKHIVGSQVVVRLPDPKMKILGERGIECIFVGYVENFKAFRFYVIEPNESLSINLITESKNAISDENRFFSVPRPSLRIPNGTEDIGSSVVLEEVTEEVVQQPEPKLSKSKRNTTLKNFEHEFQLHLIKETRDVVSNQHSYCFNVKDDTKTFNEAIKSHDVAF
nr:zinc finger, CCHC-type [Tanacetum cinerariifolium]